MPKRGMDTFFLRIPNKCPIVCALCAQLESPSVSCAVPPFPQAADIRLAVGSRNPTGHFGHDCGKQKKVWEKNVKICIFGETLR